MTRGAGFSVTFEDWSEDAIEAGEPDDHGYLVAGVSLRDAVQEFGSEAESANEWPVREPRWFDVDETCIVTGITRRKSLHVPEQVTGASRRRIARLLGLRP